MVTLTFTGTPAEIQSDMRDMLIYVEGKPAQLSVDPVVLKSISEGPQKTRTEVAEILSEVAAPAEEKPKRTRRTKAEIEAAKAGAASPVNDVFQEPVASNGVHADVPVAAPVVNKEAVHQALQQVNVAVGLVKAREILTEFKVNRISEIKEDQFKAFIEKCNAAVMLEG
jgi:hypothetical protein